VGNDSFGDFLKNSLVQNNVNIDGLVTDNENQTSASVVLSDSTGERTFLHCIHNKQEECIAVDYPEDTVTVGIENEQIGAYITYERKTLPDFLIWKMLGESEYVVGLEPRTTSLGGQDIIDNDKLVALKPFEEYKTKLQFNIEERY